MDAYAVERSPSSNDMLRLVAGLQSALTMEEVERAYLSSVVGVLDADGHGLYRLDPQTLDPVAISTDVTPSFVAKYTEYGRFDDPVMNRARELRRPVDSSRLASSVDWQASAAYSILADEGYYHSLRAPFEIAGQMCGTVTFARCRGARGFDEHDLRLARTISKQTGLALERATRFEATGQRIGVLQDVLDHLPQGIVVSSADGETIFVNSVAASRQPCGSFAEMVAPHVREAREALWRDNRRIVTANVVEPRSGRQVIAKSVKLTRASDAALTMIYPADSAQPRRLPVWDVLTPREQEIAELVSTGLTTKEIASRAFVSENTVKQHLKRIFAKTDVRNRAELMQRVWTATGRDDAQSATAMARSGQPAAPSRASSASSGGSGSTSTVPWPSSSRKPNTSGAVM
jgi:DNA-binding CsgD family transcriptional regulator/PAS domain-containing protein